jgi:hypothetical protein
LSSASSTSEQPDAAHPILRLASAPRGAWSPSPRPHLNDVTKNPRGSLSTFPHKSEPSLALGIRALVFLFLCFLFTQEASQLFLILPIARVEAIIGRSASAGADPSCMRHHLLGSRVRGVGFATRDLTCCLPVTFDVESAMPGRWPLGAGASSRRAAVSPLTPTPVRQGAGRHGTPTSSSS